MGSLSTVIRTEFVDPDSLASTRIFLPRQRVRLGRLIWGLLALLTAALALITLVSRRVRPLGIAPVRFQIALPAGSDSVTISPDGRQLAIMAPGADGRNAIWIRSLDSLEARVLPGTEDATGTPAFWSPDSRFIAYQAASKLKKIDILGGPPQLICDAPGSVLGGAWNQEGTIIFGTVRDGIMQVPAVGGTPTLVTTTGDHNEVHVFPSLLRDGRHFVYLRAPNDGIYIGSLGVPPQQQSSTRLLPASLMAAYMPSVDGHMGRLLFMREGSLLAQTLDEKRMALVGNPVLVAEQVGTFLLSAKFSASANGVMTFLAGKEATPLSGLTWFNQQGKELGTADSGDYAYSDLALSPDGTRVAASRIDPKAPAASQRIWLLDLTRGVSTPFTFDLAPDGSPVWSPSGRQVAFNAVRSGGYGIYQKPSNGTGAEQTLLQPSKPQKHPTDWSHDGRFLMFTQYDPQTNSDLWVLPLASDGTSAGSPIPFANTQFNEGQGQFSPNTRWVAYTSEESGRPEIYVQSFAEQGGGSKEQVSRDGGSQPRWSRDGKTLFYLALDGKVMAADITAGAILKVATPKPLFKVSFFGITSEVAQDAFSWDISSDGQRFLINTAKPSTAPLTVVLNWTEDGQKK